MTVDPRQLRNCLGHFTTGITVVTCAHDERPHGATVNAFSAISLDPPLVLVALDHTTKSCRFLDGNPFTVNVLREHQEALALHFAGHPMTAPVRWAPRNGLLAPRLLDVLAYLACTPWRSFDAGDHTLYLGKVEEYAYFGGDPLLFYQGRFAHLSQEVDREPWIGSLDNPEIGWLLPVPRAQTIRGDNREHPTGSGAAGYQWGDPQHSSDDRRGVHREPARRPRDLALRGESS